MTRWIIVLVALSLTLALPAAARAEGVIAVRTLAEKKTAQLPTGALVWRLETFPTKAVADAAAGPTGVVAELGGTMYLATFGPAGGASPGGTRVTEIGPLPAPRAAEYLLRVSELSGPPTSQSATHSHPGLEAYVVLAGELTVRTPGGATTAGPGQTIAALGGTPVQPVSTGAVAVQALVLFVVDAGQPFSSPATLDVPTAPGLPNTGGGGADRGSGPLLWGAGAALLAAGLLLARLPRRRMTRDRSHQA